MRLSVALLSLALISMASFAASAAEPFSHDDWTRILQRFVDDQGRVDYRGLANDRADFEKYLRRVQSTTPETAPERFPDRDHELAFYINAYNALVFQGVLERGPEEESVWSGLVSGLNFFRRQKYELGERKLNLTDLENEIVRKQYQDPRIHAALNCASVGCPRLPQEAFTGPELQQQLDEAMREFVSGTLHVDPRPGENKVRISKIFDWFKDDFVEEQKRKELSPTVLAYINRYRDEADRIPENWEVEIIPYDKAINKQPVDAAKKACCSS